jgi:hypothetical protein
MAQQGKDCQRKDGLGDDLPCDVGCGKWQRAQRSHQQRKRQRIGKYFIGSPCDVELVMPAEILRFVVGVFSL